MKKNTIEDITKQSGVFKGTVSAVLNTKTTLKTETRDIIPKVIKEYNFRQKVVARNLENSIPANILAINNIRTIRANSQDLFYNQEGAYYKISQFKIGGAILNQLKEKSTDQSLLINLESFRRSSYENFRIASDCIKEAQDQMKSKTFDKAYKLIHESLQTHETPEAYKLSGIIKLSKNKKNKASTYFKKASAVSYKSSPGLLSNLSCAYFVNAGFNKAKFTFEKLNKSYPVFKDPINLKSKLRHLQ